MQKDIAGAIANLIKEVTEGNVTISPDHYSDQLKDLGVDSVNLLHLLVAIENEYGIEWPMDFDPKSLESIDSIADYINEQVGAPA